MYIPKHDLHSYTYTYICIYLGTLHYTTGFHLSEIRRKVISRRKVKNKSAATNPRASGCNKCLNEYQEYLTTLKGTERQVKEMTDH